MIVRVLIEVWARGLISHPEGRLSKMGPLGAVAALHEGAPPLPVSRLW